MNSKMSEIPDRERWNFIKDEKEGGRERFLLSRSHKDKRIG